MFLYWDRLEAAEMVLADRVFHIASPMRNLPTVTTLGDPAGLQGSLALSSFSLDLGNRKQGRQGQWSP